MSAQAALSVKAVETWSVVVRSNNSSQAPREVVKKVVELRSVFYSLDYFDEKVHLVSKTWAEASEDISLVLEGNTEAQKVLLNSGTMYADWFPVVSVAKVSSKELRAAGSRTWFVETGAKLATGMVCVLTPRIVEIVNCGIFLLDI